MTEPTAPSIDLAGLRGRVEYALSKAEPFEAPAPGIAWGDGILNFADIRALLSAAEREQALVERVKVLEAVLSRIGEYKGEFNRRSGTYANAEHALRAAKAFAHAALANTESRDG